MVYHNTNRSTLCIVYVSDANYIIVSIVRKSYALALAKTCL